MIHGNLDGICSYPVASKWHGPFRTDFNVAEELFATFQCFHILALNLGASVAIVFMYTAIGNVSSPSVQNPSPATALLRYLDNPDLNTLSTCFFSALRLGHFFCNASKSSPTRYCTGAEGFKMSCSYASSVRNGEYTKVDDEMKDTASPRSEPDAVRRICIPSEARRASSCRVKVGSCAYTSIVSFSSSWRWSRMVNRMASCFRRRDWPFETKRLPSPSEMMRVIEVLVLIIVRRCRLRETESCERLNRSCRSSSWLVS